MEPKKAYACYLDEYEIRKSSSSGAVFSALALYVFRKKGIVYGVAMSEDCYSAEFIGVTDEIGLKRLRGSKYLQAKVGDAYKNVKRDLLSGKLVMFSGTGCQVNGLKSFLGKDYNNLICVDVICHGTPSPKLWREYAKNQESKYGKIINVNFRCKDNSWVDYGIKENQMFISKDSDSFMQMFLRNYCLRPACYKCHAKYYKTSDISIADFWGIDNVAPEMNDGKGTSLVITRTDKGQELFDDIKNRLKWKEVSYLESIKENPCEHSSVERPAERGTFFKDINSLPFRKLEIKYIEGPLWKRVCRKVKKVIMILGGSHANK